MRPSRRQTQPFTRKWATGRTTATAVLIAIHCGAAAAQFLLELVATEVPWDRGWLREWLALSVSGIQSGHYWQFASFALLHAGPVHLLANMVLLYFAGREVEPILGPRHFLTLYGLATILGGAVQWLLLSSGMAGTDMAALVGVSAGVAAVLVAFTTILPELEVPVHLFFILPLQLRARHIALAAVAIAALLCLMPAMIDVAPAGMLAGMLLGWAYTKQLGYGNPLFFQRYLFERRQRTARMQRMNAEQFMSEEIDPILDKIARQGLQSLTRAERRILDLGRDKITTKPASK